MSSHSDSFVASRSSPTPSDFIAYISGTIFSCFLRDGMRQSEFVINIASASASSGSYFNFSPSSHWKIFVFDELRPIDAVVFTD